MKRIVYAVLALLWVALRYALGVREVVDAVLVVLAVFIIVDSVPFKRGRP